jgi:hypothetical protein
MPLDHLDAEHKDAFIKASLTFQSKLQELQRRVVEGQMTVENFIDQLHGFERSIAEQDVARKKRRDDYERRGMDPDEADR